MTLKPKRDSRHITLNKEALAIYDNWKDKGEANKASQAIIEYDSKTQLFTPEQLELIRKIIREEVKIGLLPNESILKEHW